MPLKPVVLGSLAIVAFDLLASLASRSIGFPYGYATFGSWAIYALVGFAIGRKAGVGAAAAGVAVVALVEGTIGWAVSWAIGPGRPPGGVLGVGQLIGALAFVVLTGAVIGAVSGFLARRSSRVQPQP